MKSSGAVRAAVLVRWRRTGLVLAKAPLHVQRSLPDIYDSEHGYTLLHHCVSMPNNKGPPESVEALLMRGPGLGPPVPVNALDVVSYRDECTS